MKAIKIGLALLLLAANVFMGFKLVETIKEPIDFERISGERVKDAVSTLEDIRATQLAYRGMHGSYTASWDTLISFARDSSIVFEKIIGDPNDSTVTVVRDTITVSVKDSLFKGDMNRINNLNRVPHTADAKFEMSAAIITKNEVEIPAFEATVPYRVLFNGLDGKYYKDKWYDNLKVGDINLGTTTGNWDKG